MLVPAVAATTPLAVAGGGALLDHAYSSSATSPPRVPGSAAEQLSARPRN
jgi:hypothetical protein